ncbi:unspecific monooxygenase [Primorskyibacter sedentarius]|uniref:Unspecific monooxygenase n=1 Tax=Primorskyibacter sedentarius TaxID=745311 RepID=A0A4R3JP01_9RHOB|nr:cytochrome P450 [Primorskyibacter sedentarius]TCS67384.1 unspecific monooxygenase [Primorskyibacter sedentarius]
MQSFEQSPTDPVFVQDPYPAYDRARAVAPLVWWTHYQMPAAMDHATVNALLRDRRFGRECPAELAGAIPDHLRAFYAVEAHSMLELDPPRHTRLRGLVLRGFTSRRIKELAPEIDTLATQLARDLPQGPVDVLAAYATPLPVIVIARLLGVPDNLAPQLLAWSNAMVAMYQARRNRAIEDAAATAAQEFSDFLRGYVEERRAQPADDLITHLIAAEEEGEKLSTDELITTCILLLNAGHEATVHTLGNGLKALLQTGTQNVALADMDLAVEEILRHDPPLHIFTRYALEPVTIHGHEFRRGDQVALMLGAANRDPAVWDAADRFDPARPAKPHTSFGAGVHFCVGAPLARLELRIGLTILLRMYPNLRMVEPARYADLYHFHGLEHLIVETT